LNLSNRSSLIMLVVLLGYGCGSVFYWNAFDDLRFYAIAQFYPLVAIPAVLWWFPPQYSRGGDWMAALAIYVAAKIFEHFDGHVFEAGFGLSGHTMKHCLAALGAFWILRMLRQRVPLSLTPVLTPVLTRV
jgi:hypothetical protein